MLTNRPFLWRAERSSDQACLCLHGLGGGIYELEILAQRLHQRGLTVRGINYPGHDHPTPRMPPSSWPEWYGAIEQAYGELRQEYDQISIVAFSTGCPLGLHLAARYPIQKLVLLSPFYRLRHRWYYLFRPEDYLDSILGQLIDDVPRLRLPITDPHMRQQAGQILVFRSFNLSAVRSALELIGKLKSELPEIHNPTLILQSHRDSVVDPTGAEAYYQGLGSEGKQLIWLKRSDHLITLDIEREQVYQVACRFLVEEDHDQ